MNTKDELIKKLEEKGGRYWSKNGKERIYFSPKNIFNLIVNYYKSGYISSAKLDGDYISNAEAARCLNVACYVDVTGNAPRVITQNADRIHAPARKLLDNFVAEISEVIEESKK